MIKLSPSVENLFKLFVSKNITDIFTSQALNIVKSYDIKDKITENIFIDNLSSQLPDGIYTSINDIKNLIATSIKIIETDSLSYSPLSLNFKELSPCKIMKYQQGNIITGRDKEIESILLTLSKKNKRGCILIGPAGVGKTALVNAVNARLIERTVPRQLKGCYILNMDVPYILSKHKDDPITVIINILEKASEYDKVILFIDEVHQLLGHKMNDILKPYLTEKIRFIGSTTINEYHSIITEDSALERRFTVIPVNEPNIEETIKMIIGTKSVYEDHHKCIIPNEICKKLVETGSRFLGTRKNPDKSLDILDIACSIMYEREIKQTDVNILQSDNKLLSLDKNRKELESIVTIAGKRVLTDKYINLAISSVTGVDYDQIENSLDYNFISTELKSNIFGQNEQIDKLSNIVNIFKNVKYDRERPISILLYIGPSGCGKKTSAQLLSQYLFGSKNYFIDYDMSGFKQEFSLTELKGAPPGYVGYAKSGGLIKAVRTNPLSVVYFRGINHAHDTIKSYIVDCCRTGKMTDSAEREAKLNNTIIIFSVTLEEKDLESLYNKQTKTMGFSINEDKKDSNELSKDKLKELIGEDVVNISDEIIVFNKLNENDISNIYDKNLDYYLNMYNIKIDTKSLKAQITSDSKNGHDVISKLSSEIPRQVFQTLSKEKSNVKVKVSKKNQSNDSIRKTKRLDSKTDC
jgi:ATP-dependent Clp protease ATP-binding subunit ClpC